MLRCLDADDIAEQAVGDGFPQIDVERGVAEHEADHHLVRAAMLAQQPQQVVGLAFRDHHRLFAENLQAQSQGGGEVTEMEVVGRADQQQVRCLGGVQRLDAVVGFAGGDAVFGKAGEAGWCGIDVADHLEPWHQGREHARQIAQPVAEADDAGLHAGVASCRGA